MLVQNIPSSGKSKKKWSSPINAAVAEERQAFYLFDLTFNYLACDIFTCCWFDNLRPGQWAIQIFIRKAVPWIGPMPTRSTSLGLSESCIGWCGWRCTAKSQWLLHLHCEVLRPCTAMLFSYDGTLPSSLLKLCWKTLFTPIFGLRRVMRDPERVKPSATCSIPCSGTDAWNTKLWYSRFSSNCQLS